MLTKQQIESLRADYAKVERFNTDRLPDLRRILGQLQPAALKQVAEAEIKFVSVIAQNMINEKKVKK